MISVVIAVWNDARHLAAAIESVRAQGLDDVELIVVDDGSTDESAAVGEGSGADLVLRLPTNTGPSMARNVGIAHAHGELITFLDADDRMLPGRLSTQERFLAEHREMSGVFAEQRDEIEPGTALPSWFGVHGLRADESAGMSISVMVRAGALVAVGGFDPELRFGEDVDLLIRCERAGAPIGRLPDVLTVKSLHGANATFQVDDVWSGMLRSVRGARRRSPLVSVVIPVYNGGRYLTDAVDSALSQGLDDLEVIVIDDGSTDDSLAVATRLAEVAPAVRVFSEPGGGAGAARNLGVLLARGRFVAMLDADDVWMPDKLARQLALFETEPELDVVFGWTEEFVSPELPAEVAARFHPRLASLGHANSSMLARRDAMSRVGFYRPGRAGAEYPEWYLRAVQAGLAMGSVPEVVLRRRLHGENHSFRYDTVRTQYFDLLRGAIAKQRGR